jgi:hypothetical protein
MVTEGLHIIQPFMILLIQQRTMHIGKRTKDVAMAVVVVALALLIINYVEDIFVTQRVAYQNLIVD